MMRHCPTPIATATLGTLAALATFALAAPAAPKPKYTIKQVMKEAIKGDTALVKKACKGTATPDELARLVAYCRALGENAPPKGELDSWKQKSTALYDAALAVEKDPKDKDASFRLEQAVECRQCHNPHKPDKKK